MSGSSEMKVTVEYDGITYTQSYDTTRVTSGEITADLDGLIDALFSPGLSGWEVKPAEVVQQQHPRLTMGGFHKEKEGGFTSYGTYGETTYTGRAIEHRNDGAIGDAAETRGDEE